MGSVHQKYVYNCFMVKMGINFGSYWLLWVNLGWRQCTSKNFGKLEILDSSGQKVKI